MRSSRVLGLVALAACAPTLTEQQAGEVEEGTPLFECQVARGPGEGYFRRDELRCAPVAGATFAPAVDATAANGSPAGTLVVGDGHSIGYFADAYPLAVRAYGTVQSQWLGIENTQLAMRFAVQNAEQWATAHGLATPFDVVTLAIENRTTFGSVRLDPWSLTLAGGAELRVTGEVRTTTTVAPPSLLLRVGESRTLRIPVTRGTATVHGRAGAESGELVSFDVGSGSYVLTDAGLVERDDVAPPAAGAEVARCVDRAGTIECSVVPRSGVEIRGAAARVGEQSFELPADGTPVAIGPRVEQGTTAAISMGIAGIDGLPAGLLDAFTGEISVSPETGIGTLDLPFALLHSRMTYEPDLQFGFFDRGQAQVRFGRPLNGAYEVDSPATLQFGPDRPEIWIAVTAGTTAISGTLSVLTTSGLVTDLGTVELADGAYYLGRTGLRPLEAPAAGLVLVSCFVEAGDHLVCLRDETAPIGGASCRIGLERFDRSFERPLSPGRSALLSLGPLYPVTLELTVDLVTSAVPLVATARLESGANLPESAPLVITAP